jgi:endonuclease-3 related protein
MDLRLLRSEMTERAVVIPEGCYRESIIKVSPIKPALRKLLLKNYHILHKYFGPQHWWPGNSLWEIIVGAILTQNTAWTNVEKAIQNLKKEKCLDISSIHSVSRAKLERLIRPAGFFTRKAVYLKLIAAHIIENYSGSLTKLFSKDTQELRRELLGLKGVGPETADSILLYAGSKPVFVVDAYTKRILDRWGIPGVGKYDDIQRLFHENIPLNIALYNEYHALLVALAKCFCHKKRACAGCPLYCHSESAECLAGEESPY